MTRYEMVIHMVFSPQNWPTGRLAPALMMRASSTARMFPFSCKTFATLLETITWDPPRLTMVAASARQPEAPIQKTP